MTTSSRFAEKRASDGDLGIQEEGETPIRVGGDVTDSGAGDTISIHAKSQPNPASDNDTSNAASIRRESSTSDESGTAAGEQNFPATRATEARLDPDNPWLWLLGRHRRNICSEVRKKKSAVNDEESQGSRRFRVNIAELQRMRLVQLQCKVVKSAMTMCNSDDEPGEWDTDVHNYVQALQDYDYMCKWGSLARDPFIVTGERKLDRIVVHRVMQTLGGGLENREYHRVKPLGPWEEEYIPIGDTRSGGFSARWVESLINRLVMMMISIIFILGPMWIMVRKPEPFVKLGVTTGFVIVFGVAMALFLTKTQDVIASTAAYAAVLMVFVGASDTAASSSG